MSIVGKRKTIVGTSEILACPRADFRRLPLIFALLLYLCACTTENTDASLEIAAKAKEEAAGDAVREEQSPFGRRGAILPAQEESTEELNATHRTLRPDQKAEEKIKTEPDGDHYYEKDRHCLSFQEGKGINHIDEFMIFIKMSPHDKKWTYGIFSAKYDLNDDGNDEYFYYIESMPFCGTIGCSIHVYEYKNGVFRKLSEYGIMTNNFFDPRKKEDWDYLCVGSETDSGWKRLHQKKLSSTFFYNGQKYIGLKSSK
jgi:hypothetical protein